MADRAQPGTQEHSSLRSQPRVEDFSQPRKMKGSPFDQPDCWFCGARDVEAFTDEYGWYEEMIGKEGGVSVTVKSEVNTYMPIGQRSVSICSRCIAEHGTAEDRSSAKVLRWMTVLGLAGTFLSGIFYGFLDWLVYVPVLDEIYFLLSDVWRHDTGNHVLAEVFAFALAGASMLMLVPAATMMVILSFAQGQRLLRGKAARHNRRASRGHGESGVSRGHIRSWAREVGAAQLMRENAKTDPFFLFHPHADDDGQRHFGLANRKDWIREFDGKTFRHWIEHRRPYVDHWETKSTPQHLDEQTRAQLSRRGLKPPGGWL